jgi:hypothetical protein
MKPRLVMPLDTPVNKPNKSKHFMVHNTATAPHLIQGSQIDTFYAHESLEQGSRYDYAFERVMPVAMTDFTVKKVKVL